MIPVDSTDVLYSRGRSVYVGVVKERNPAYCDVILKRWETLTGGKAVHVATEAP